MKDYMSGKVPLGQLTYEQKRALLSDSLTEM
jgi:hypothetical protein